MAKGEIEITVKPDVTEFKEALKLALREAVNEAIKELVDNLGDLKSQWEQIEDVPDNIVVQDTGGVCWRNADGELHLRNDKYSDWRVFQHGYNPNEYGPFTRV